MLWFAIYPFEISLSKFFMPRVEGSLFMELLTAENLIAFITLAVMEIVLGIDNVIFISILAGKLPVEQQAQARRIGLIMALGTRIVLLLSLSFLAHLENSLFTIPWPFGDKDHLDITARDLVMLAGGLFLIYKATHEIHEKLEGEEGAVSSRTAATFASVVTQIALLDIVFSLDSVITAIGMADQIVIMVAAVVVAVVIMLFASASISSFVNQHPTVKMLALSFLLLIGVTLMIEAVHVHIPKGYVYFAMGFSVFVEMLNLAARRRAKPVQLHQSVTK
jgi:predicted tellurium resistance membrane protein TerC